MPSERKDGSNTCSNGLVPLEIEMIHLDIPSNSKLDKLEVPKKRS